MPSLYTYRCITPTVLVETLPYKPRTCTGIFIYFLLPAEIWGLSVVSVSSCIRILFVMRVTVYGPLFCSLQCGEGLGGGLFIDFQTDFFFKNTKAIVDNSSTSFHDFFLHRVQVSIFLDN